MKFVGRLCRKVRWILIAMVIPEILVAIAAGNFAAARAGFRKMGDEIPELVHQGRWTLTHTFYANMGGFVLREEIIDESGVLSRAVSALDCDRIISSLKSGLLSFPLSFITEDEIQDKSKGDVFLKLTAAFQVLWLIVQVCARRAQKLATSQLEIAILAFSVCSFVCYLLWIKKPQHVGVPTYLDAARPITCLDLLDLADTDESTDWKSNLGIPSDEGPGPADGITIKWHGKSFASVSVTGVGLVLGGIVFGGIHLLAWDFQFPTQIEKKIWRAASLLTTVLPPILYSVRLKVTSWTENTHIKPTAVFIVLMAAIGLFTYGVCRLFLLVEIFRSLGYLPAEAFVGTWPTYTPHVV